eukprot:m.171396 g.171396  ORF g.171396 m.171396 type:complete len:573 (+) comp14550_c0_seq2:661-2379(+)
MMQQTTRHALLSLRRVAVTKAPVKHMSLLGQLPPSFNEPVKDYPKGSPARDSLLQECERVRSEVVDIPVVIGGKEYFTGDVVEQRMPTDHGVTIARVHHANRELIEQGIESAVSSRREWEMMDWVHRAAVFLKAADIMTSIKRDRIIATTMLGQGKTAFQAEIDAAAETADFFRFAAHAVQENIAVQPKHHSPMVWNRMEYRALEGFIAGIPPFNFTAIGANLGATPAIMGNVVLWKPSDTAALSNYEMFKIMREAGIPDGVINFVPAQGPLFGEVTLSHRDLAAVNFTGSTQTFNHIWKTVANNLEHFRTYPRVIGECGGKNFHFVHPSADVANVVANTVRSAFEYQGQKCSACSRVYVPRSMWQEFKDGMLSAMKDIRMGQPDDFSSFVTAVIDDKAFKKISGFVDFANQSSDVEVLAGGSYDDSRGYFVEPTFVRVDDPRNKLMEEEIFGPVLTAYVYDDDCDLNEMLELVDSTSPYGLTGAIFASDRSVVESSMRGLRHAAGNIYINVKSTGSVVGQQPFGGARRSGTNDKAGASSYLLRFTSVQSIKECLATTPDWKYPHMLGDMEE